MEVGEQCWVPAEDSAAPKDLCGGELMGWQEYPEGMWAGERIGMELGERMLPIPGDEGTGEQTAVELGLCKAPGLERP